MSQTEVAIFRSVDVPIGRIEDVVDAVGPCVTDEKITRRSVAAGPRRILDLVDGAEELDAADAMQSFLEDRASWICSSGGKVMNKGPPLA